MVAIRQQVDPTLRVDILLARLTLRVCENVARWAEGQAAGFGIPLQLWEAGLRNVVVWALQDAGVLPPPAPARRHRAIHRREQK
jgi:hypothetical protein